MSAPLQWITGRDTGISSKAIWSHMMIGKANGDTEHPHDADDFGRCYRLLDLIPEWELRLNEMAKYSAEWAALVAHWSELKIMYETAIKAKGDWKKWVPLCDKMNDLTTAARVCRDCGKVGMNAWSTYPNGDKRCGQCANAHRGAA